jgi:hypothetical protein
VTHRPNIINDSDDSDEKLRELAMGITGKTDSERVEQQVSVTEHNQSVYEFTAESNANIPVIMFTVFGILGGIAIASGVVVLLLARGRQV